VTSLLIRNVDDALHARLKDAAARHHRSLEEEARALLREGVARQEGAPRENLADLAQRLFGRARGADLDIPLRGAPARAAPDFSGPDGGAGGGS
jgi:antitoxin FitA